LTRNGLAAHLTASHGSGPLRHQHRTPTRTGPTTMGQRSTWTYPVTLAPVATPVQMPPTRAPDHLGPGTIGIRVSSSPSRPGHHWPGPSTSSTPGHFGPRAPGPPLAGPKHLVHSGPLRTSCGTTHLESVRYPVNPGFKFPANTTVSGSLFFSPIIDTKRDFLFALQSLHHLLGSRRHLLLYFDPCSYAT
jgi:hypothetical protein